ncbi:MAG: hypothetical protein ACLQAH_08485 [Limisphaerales bacterium]
MEGRLLRVGVCDSADNLLSFFPMKTEINPASETPFEKFRQFTKKIVAVPKSEIDRREKQYQKARKTKRHSL